MTYQIKLLCSAILILSATLFGVATYKRNVYAKYELQGSNRILVIKAHFNPPVTIKSMRNNRRVIESEKAFAEGDDWLSGLAFTLSNRSGKEVVFVDVELLFPRLEGDSRFPSLWHMRYGRDPFLAPAVDSSGTTTFKAMAPGADFQIGLSDEQVTWLKSFLRETGFPDSIQRVEARVITVGFKDDTVWSVGKVFRRNPQDQKGPVKGWTIIESPDENSPNSKYPVNNQHGALDLFRSSAFNPVSGTFRTFLRAGWKGATAVQTTECGEGFFTGHPCGQLPECSYKRGNIIASVPTHALAFFFRAL